MGDCVKRKIGKTFGLFEFCFGCTVGTGQGIVEDVAQCTITLAGFAPKTGKEVAVASYTFSLPGDTTAQMPIEHAVLPDGFQAGLGNVTMTMNSELVGLVVDNTHYRVSIWEVVFVEASGG